jgi:hypothetical protein
LKEYENVMFHNGESVDDFAMHINRLVTSLRELDEKMEDGHVVRKILRLVPKKLRQVAVAIEMLVDLDTMTMEELVSRLRMAEAADIEDVAYGMTAVPATHGGAVGVSLLPAHRQGRNTWQQWRWSQPRARQGR